MEKDKTIDIVALVQDHPLTKLSMDDYGSKIINKIKKKFTTLEQHLFVTNFYTYLNYDTRRDFVVELDKVWKWIGFSQKVRAKELLVNNFTKDQDYVIEKPAFSGEKAGQNFSEEGKNLGGSGLNLEVIKLTVHCFKKLCLKAKTKKSDEIHEYYINLEEIMNETVLEESDQLKNQLMLKDVQLISIKEKTMLDAYDEKPVIYVGYTEDNIVKFGFSNDIKTRVGKHKTQIGSQFILEFIVESIYNREIEIMIKQNLNDKIISREYLGKNQTELIQLDKKFTIKKLQDTILMYKDSFKNGEMIIKLLDENEQLREKVKNSQEDLSNGSLIYIKHIDDTLQQYIVDLTDDSKKSTCIYLTPNAKKIKKMVYTLLDSYKVTENSFEMTYDKIKKAVEYCISMYDNYKIEKSENHLYTYLNRCIEDKNLLQESKIFIDRDIFKSYVKKRFEYGISYKITVIQIYEDFKKWYLDKYNKSTDNISDYNLKNTIIKLMEDITKIEKTKVCITDKINNKRMSSYPGFVGIRLIEEDKKTFYDISVYEQYVDNKIIITDNANDKLLRVDIINDFEKWINSSKIERNPNIKGEQRYTLKFLNEITSMIKNITEVEYEADKHYTSNTTKGGKGYFVGLQLT